MADPSQNALAPGNTPQRPPFAPLTEKAVPVVPATPNLPNHDQWMNNKKNGATKADRQAAYEQEVTSQTQIWNSQQQAAQKVSDYNASLPDLNAKGFKLYQDQGSQATQDATQNALKTHQESPEGQTWGTRRQFAPWAGMALGGLESAAIHRVVRPGSLVPYLGFSALEGGAASLFNQPSPSDTLLQRDKEDAAQRLGIGAAGGNALGGLISLYDRGAANDGSGNTPPPPPPPPPPDTPDQAKLKAGARTLGASPDINPSDAKAFIEARRTAGDMTATEKTALWNALGEAAKPGATFTRVLGKLAPALALGIGVGAAALGPDSAEASPYAPGEDALNPLPSRGEKVVNALSRAGGAVAAIPGNLLAEAQNLPASLRQNTFGMSGGEFGMSPEQFEAMNASQNLRSAQAEDARQVAEMKAKQAAAAPRQFPQASPADYLAMDKMLHSSQRPDYQAALRELIESHGGQLQ